jgi:hypothetical protein
MPGDARTALQLEIAERKRRRAIELSGDKLHCYAGFLFGLAGKSKEQLQVERDPVPAAVVQNALDFGMPDTLVHQPQDTRRIRLEAEDQIPATRPA